VEEEHDYGDNQQEVNGSARDVEGSPSQQPAQKKDHEQDEENEIRNKTHLSIPFRRRSAARLLVMQLDRRRRSLQPNQSLALRVHG
jgi:hypothetical protein